MGTLCTSTGQSHSSGLRGKGHLGQSKDRLRKNRSVSFFLLACNSNKGSPRLFGSRYAVPLVQKILGAKSRGLTETKSRGASVKAVVLVPSKELSQQAAANIKACGSVVLCLYVATCFPFEERLGEVKTPSSVRGHTERLAILPCYISMAKLTDVELYNGCRNFLCAASKR